MPIYEYQCQKCQHVFEHFQHGYQEEDIQCPDCQAAHMKKIIHSPGIVFKGSGFYVNDKSPKKPS